MKTKIEIRSVFGELLFEYEKENNTVKDTVIEALERGADLRSANLRSANLQCAYLRDADLRGAYLRGADLQCADLWRADLRGADLQYADLRGADLRGADLQCADLRGAYLQDIKIDDINKLKQFYWIIPEEGSFIAWKKLSDNCIAKIEIPAEAKRTCNLMNPRKCRAEFCKVLEIRDQDGNDRKSAFNCTYSETKLRYGVGKLIYPDSYDDSIYQDCSHGIHFFITRQEAIDWNN